MINSKVFNIKEDSDFVRYYPIFYEWWNSWKHFKSPIPPEMLSKNGVLISHGDIPICAGWVFSTDSNTAIAGWLISTKKHKDKRKECLYELIIQLENLAKKLGFELLNFPASNPYLRDKLENLGFGDYADKNITNYFKNISWVDSHQQ